MHTESERKYEDISRKMATLEADSQRGNERADGAEKKISVGHHIVKGNGKNNILIYSLTYKGRLGSLYICRIWKRSWGWWIKNGLSSFYESIVEPGIGAG